MRLTITALLAGLLATAGAMAAQANLSTVNKSLRIDAGERAGNIESVNGSIRVNSRADVGRIESVNGGIRLGDDVSAGSVQSVNGSITIGNNARIAGEVGTVNGGVQIGAGSAVQGLSTVNGSVDLDSVLVDGDIESVNASLTLRSGTRVTGDVLIRKRKGGGMSGWFGKSKPPRLVIEDDVVIEGRLILERKVDLKMADGARVGEIVGEYHDGR